MAIDNETGKAVALKIVRRKLKSTECLEKLEAEVACLKKCHAHPNIITLLDFISTPRKIGVVTDVARGGDLFDHVLRAGALPERTAIHLFTQLMQAVHYMHCVGVAHRDIKPENLLLNTPQHLLLCDFGMATMWSPQEGELTSVAGTVRCLPPEMVKRSGYEYSYLPFPADIYSCGIVLFFMFTGTFPFESVTNQQTLRNTVNRTFTSALPSHVASDARRLMERMICASPGSRPTAREVLEDPYMQGSQ